MSIKYLINCEVISSNLVLNDFIANLCIEKRIIYEFLLKEMYSKIQNQSICKHIVYIIMLHFNKISFLGMPGIKVML